MDDLLGPINRCCSDRASWRTTSRQTIDGSERGASRQGAKLAKEEAEEEAVGRKKAQKPQKGKWDSPVSRGSDSFLRLLRLFAAILLSLAGFAPWREACLEFAF